MNSLIPALFLPYVFVVLGGGITALVFQFRDDLRYGRGNPLEPWRLKWTEALLISWGIITALLALAIALSHVASRFDDSASRIALHVIGGQSGLLLLLVGLIYLYPSQFTLKLSPQKLGFWRILQQALLHFLAALILFIPVNLCWRAVLSFLEKQGYGSFMEKQEIVTLLAKAASLPPVTLILLVVAVVIIAPIAEEILFRGLFYRFLKSKISPRWAMIVSSACFAAMHDNKLSLLPLMFLGMMLVRAYERTGNLKVPILMHAFFNANATFILLISPHLEAAAKQIAN